MSLQKTTLVAFLVAGLFTVIGCKNKEVITTQSRLQHNSLELSPQHFPDDEDLHHDSENGVSYLVKNDDLNLYLFFEFTNPQHIRKIAFAGATLWIDTKAKSKERFGIAYPLPAEPGRRPTDNEGRRPSTSDHFKGKDRLKVINGDDTYEQYHLSEGDVNAVIYPDTTFGIARYAARIPIASLEDDKLTKEGWPDKLSVGFKAGERSEFIPPVRRGGRGMRGRGGRGGMGGRGGGGRRMPPADTEVEPLEIWWKVQLSNNSKK